MEFLCLIVWRMRQEIEFQKSRSVVQALMSTKWGEAKDVEKAFGDLKDAFFPFDKNAKVAEEQQLKDVLMREIRRGPLTVIPMANPDMKKVASKLERGQQALRQGAAERLAGRVVKLDPLGTAKRRPRTSR